MNGGVNMPHRRTFLKQALMAVTVQALVPPFVLAAPRRPDILSVTRREETILRSRSLGDGYHMTWTREGHQAVGVNDGSGWADPPTAFYNTRLWTISGAPGPARFDEVASYPLIDRSTRPEEAPVYYGSGLLAVGEHFYQFISTLDNAEDRPRHWTGAKLIFSDDGGRTWRNRDGSTPVTWEDWGEQARGRFNFFQEPDGCFSLLSILQMGRNYGANRDGYIYTYSPNGNTDGKMNELVMFRVPVARMLDRGAYEFFAGHRPDGGADWSKDIAARAPVHVFPRGWVNYTNLFPGDLVLESWLPSVVYNEPLGLYMMAAAGIGVAPDGTEFGKPSYLGLWVGETPWGPWRQVHAEPAWMPGGDAAARAYGPRIAPGWVAPDGKSFWLVWADLNGIRSFATDQAQLSAALEKADNPLSRTRIEADFLRRYMPGFSFNAQRIDLATR
jgi:hypothetical protein